MIPPLAAARPFSVVVIGGGLAGLSAVQTLVRESSQQQQPEGILPVAPRPKPPPMHITLLEAKDRLGGRVHTISLAAAAAAAATTDDADADTTHVADMGGMYFHGQGSVLKSLQEAFPEWKTTGSGGDSAVPGGQEASYKVYNTNNNDDINNKNESRDSGMLPLLTARDLTRQEQKGMSKVYHEWTTHMEQRLQEFQKDNNNNNNRIDDDVSHHPALFSQWSQEFCARAFALEQQQQQQQEKNDGNDEPLLRRRGLEFYQRLHFDLDFAIAWKNVAMHGWTNDWDFFDLPGDDIISVHGMRQLIQAMEMQLLDNTNNSDGEDTPTLTIRKETRVERIEYDLDDRPASTSSTSLTTTTEQSPCCRIITSDQDIFEADACICTIPVGVLKKRARQLFVPPLPNDKLQALERAGVGTLNTLVVEWSKPIHCYCTNKDHEQPGSSSTAVASAYYLMGADDETTTSNPLWHGFVCPAMLRNQEEDATITQFHFYETENIPFDNMDFWKQQALQVVQAVVGSSSSTRSADNQPQLCLEDIVNVHVSAWHLDPEFMGSYSAPTTTTRGNEDRKILAEPVLGRPSSGSGGGLYFAGEHTHYKGRFATMDGAYETGIRAARQVLQQQQQQRKGSGSA